MKYLSILILLGCPSLIFCQNISLEVQAVASGFTIDNEGHSVDWTLGVPFSQVILEDHHLTEGFHQGALIKTSNNFVDTAGMRSATPDSLLYNNNSLAENISFSLYPNPCTDDLTIQVQTSEPTSISFELIDARGNKMLQGQRIISSQEDFSLPGIEKLIPGIYFVKIYLQDTAYRSLSFIKK